MAAPEWRLEILADVKELLRREGFRGYRARFWKDDAGRRFYVQILGGSDQHDTDKLSIRICIGVDFLHLLPPGKHREQSAYVALWHGWLPWFNAQNVRELDWRAYSYDEARDLLEKLRAALPEALTKVQRKFKTWHDVLVYLDKDVRYDLDPPGSVSEMRLPITASD